MGRVVWSKQLVVRWPFLAALFVALLLACVLVFPRFLVDQGLRRGQQLLPAERVKAENDARTTLLQGVAGLVLLFGARAAWRQLQISREQLQHNLEASRQQLEAGRQELQLSREGQITERFTRAIDQVDYTKSLEVRLGAIYALERIALDSERDHWPIMEVLTAYVRQHAPWSPRRDEQPGGATQPGPLPAPDIQAILTVIGRRERTFRMGEDRWLDLKAADLRGGNFMGAHLEGALLMRTHLESADLTAAHLAGAFLGGAHLEGAFFVGAFGEGAIGLTQQQIDLAITDENTKLPDYLAPPRARPA